MPDSDQFEAAAHEAVNRWGIKAEAVELVSMSENAVFRIDQADGPPAILRLHRPGYNTTAQMESELVWVDSLRSTGLDIPSAIRTPTGEGYVAVKVGNETRQAGLVEWVDGVCLENVVDDDPTLVPTHFHKLGAIMAQIRDHSENWDVPADFDRRRWDAEGLVGADALWGRFWEVDALTAPQRDLLGKARARLYEQFKSLPIDRESFGLIHADLHLHNVLASGDRLVVIDFDDSGWGWYPYELAVALRAAKDVPWFEDALRSLIDGYNTVHALRPDELELIPALIAVRTMISIGWLDARPELGAESEMPRIVDRAMAEAETYLAANR